MSALVREVLCRVVGCSSLFSRWASWPYAKVCHPLHVRALQRPCGCLIDTELAIADRCLMHRMAGVLGWLNGEGHEECCDLPMVRGLADQYGAAAVMEAIPHASEAVRDYAHSLMRTLAAA